MEKKSIVSRCNPTGSFTSVHGELFSWDVAFENGDAGRTLTKKKEAPFELKKEYEYEIEEKVDTRNNKYFKISKVNTKKSKYSNPESMLKSFAIKYATRSLVEIGMKVDKTSDKFNEAIQKSVQVYYREMKKDVAIFGEENTSVIGTAMSNAIDAVVAKKIDQDKIFVFYRVLITAILEEKKQ